jgi:hypothetical protein
MLNTFDRKVNVEHFTRKQLVNLICIAYGFGLKCGFKLIYVIFKVQCDDPPDSLMTQQWY